MYVVGIFKIVKQNSISFACFGVSANLSFLPAPVLCLCSPFAVPCLPYKCCFDIIVTRCPTTPSINRHLCTRWYKQVGNNLVPRHWTALSGSCDGDQTGLMTVARREIRLQTLNYFRDTFSEKKSLFHEPDTPLKISVPKKHELYSRGLFQKSTFSLITLKMSRIPLSALITVTPMTLIIFSALHYQTMLSLAMILLRIEIK